MNSTEATQTVGSARAVTSRRRANSDVVRPYAVGCAVLTAVVGLQWLLPNPYSLYGWFFERDASGGSTISPGADVLLGLLLLKILIVCASASAPFVARRHA